MQKNPASLLQQNSLHWHWNTARKFSKPYGVTSPTKENISAQHIPLAGINASSKPNNGEDQLPKHPKTLPFPLTETNIKRLKDWLLKYFAKTAFKNNGTFTPISGPTAHIHLKKEQSSKPDISCAFPLQRNSKAGPLGRQEKGHHNPSTSWHAHWLV